ncbi:MAG: DnaT-like ssDNA-binding protein [Rickettsiales bacterium]
MALVIEDGSIVSGANSYITVAEYSTWADARFGASRSTLPADTAAYEAIILRAMDYFEGLDFQGVLVTRGQELQWPRSGVTIDGYDQETDSIPNEVKKALYEITYTEETGVGALNPIDRKVESEKIGPIAVTYASGSSSRTISPALSRSLRKLTSGASSLGGSTFMVTRR